MRDTLETSTLKEKYNTRVSFEDLEDDMIGTASGLPRHGEEGRNKWQMAPSDWDGLEAQGTPGGGCSATRTGRVYPPHPWDYNLGK